MIRDDKHARHRPAGRQVNAERRRRSLAGPTSAILCQAHFLCSVLRPEPSCRLGFFVAITVIFRAAIAEGHFPISELPLIERQ